MSRTLPNIGAILRPASALDSTPSPGTDLTSRVDTPIQVPSRPKSEAGIKRTHQASEASEVPVESASPMWDVTDAAVSAEGDSTIYLVPRQVYLPRSTHARAKAYAAVSGIPVTEMVVTALSELHAALPAYLTQEKMRDDASAAGDLYSIPQRARRKRSPDRQVQTSIRVTDQQLIVMDELATRYGVNRSKLLAVCLQMWLAERVPSATRA